MVSMLSSAARGMLPSSSTVMNSKTLSSFLALLLTGLGLFAGAAEPRPNLVLLLTDDQNYASMGCTGNDQVKTPQLDRLARDGLIFDAAYDTTSICMASRAQVMTGMYEYKTGCNFSHGPLTTDKWQKSYPVLLRAAGYHTGFIGKFGFAVKPAGGSANYHHDEDLPIDSFDVWLGWPGQGSYKTEENAFLKSYAGKYPHVTRALGAASQDFIKGAKEHGKPFCLSVSFKAPHGPMSPDPAFDKVYAGTTWNTAPNVGAAGAAHLPEQAKSGRQFRTIRDFSDGKYNETMRKYQQLIHGIDHAVGMIRDELAAQGVADNTVILLLTDNGYNCGSHDFGGKVLPYEEGSRSPMILFDPRHPRAGQQKRTQALAGNIDAAPTLLDLAGLPIPANMDGKSLRPLLDDPEARVHERLLLINVWGSEPTHSLGIVSGTHKYIHWPFAQGMTPAEELYDLENDRFEMRNLAASAEHAAVLASLRQKHDEALAVWKTECVDSGSYAQYAAFFDRELSWEDKLGAMDKRNRRKFEEWTPLPTKAEKAAKKPKVKKPDDAAKTNPKKAERAAARAKKIAERDQAKEAERAKKKAAEESR